jgi:hypothetical protein
MNRRSFAVRTICGIAAALGLRPPKPKRPERVWEWQPTILPKGFSEFGTCNDPRLPFGMFLTYCWFPYPHQCWHLKLSPDTQTNLSFECSFTVFHKGPNYNDAAKREAERIANAILDSLEGENHV